MRMFKGQDRLFQEQRKIQAVIGEKIPLHELDYMRNHPAFEQSSLQYDYFTYLKNHLAFAGTEFLRGKIQIKISAEKI